MDQLWAPWRLDYVAAPPKPVTGSDCFICRGLAETSDSANLIAQRTALSVVVLNRYPYSNGHLLVAPLAHKGNLLILPTTNCSICKRRSANGREVHRVLRPDGYNIGLNLETWPAPVCRATCIGHRPAVERRHELHAGFGQHESDIAVARCLVRDVG